MKNRRRQHTRGRREGKGREEGINRKEEEEREEGRMQGKIERRGSQPRGLKVKRVNEKEWIFGFGAG
jgi:hypothetical protein